MKKLLIAAVVAGLVGTANAQSAFEGFYGQLSTGYENNSIGSSTTTTTTSPNIGTFLYSNPSYNFSSMPLIAALGYTFSVSNQFTLGLGADYSFLKAKSGNWTATSPGQDPQQSYTKTSNRMNFFLTPGYVVDKNSLAYAKVGYSRQKVEYFDTSSNDTLGNANVNGYILGLGYKQLISGGFYAFGEANYMAYSKTSINFSSACERGCNTFSNSTPTPSSAYNLLVGVGYRF